MGAKSSYGRIRMISVIIPIYNEEEMLKQYDTLLYPTIDRLERAVSGRV